MKVAYLGHLGAATGFGRVARETCHAMLTANIDLRIVPLGQSVEDMAALLSTNGNHELVPCLSSEVATEGVDAIVICALPYECRRIYDHLELSPESAKKIIAQTSWEAWSEVTPTVLGWWSVFDQVWTPNKWQEWQVLPHHQKHVAIPTAIDESRARSYPVRAADGLYVFYYVGHWDVRKNPMGVIRAFCHTFSDKGRVELRIHSAGVDQTTFQHALLSTGIHSDRLPSIKLSNEHLPDAGIEAFHLAGDCFVTASRGEAWNLPCFDALLYQRNIIAPAGQGSDDFLRGTTAQLFDSIPVPAFGNVMATRTDKGMKMSMTTPQGLDGKSLWQEPNLWMMGTLMWRAYTENRQTTITAEGHLARRFGRQAVGALILAELEAGL